MAFADGKDQAGPKKPGTSFEDCLNYAVRLLRGREYSVFELERKLSARFAREVSLQVIARCQELNYQSDDRTCDQLARHMQYCSYGPKKFWFEAKKRRLSEDLIAKYSADIPWEQCALEALKRKLGYQSLEDLSYEQKQKLLSFLVRRGFTPSQALRAFKDFAQDLS